MLYFGLFDKASADLFGQPIRSHGSRGRLLTYTWRKRCRVLRLASRASIIEKA